MTLPVSLMRICLRTNTLDKLGPLLLPRTKKNTVIPLCGNSRMTFKGSDGYVYKIARNTQGILDNSREANWNHPIMKMAACEIIRETTFAIPVLKMEYVRSAAYEKGLPTWVMSVDCQQVGYNAQGELVIYDL